MLGKDFLSIIIKCTYKLYLYGNISGQNIQHKIINVPNLCVVIGHELIKVTEIGIFENTKNDQIANGI